MDIYVSSPNAALKFSASDATFSSVSDAKAAIRAMLKAGIKEPITVHIAKGCYPESPMIFTEEDSGTEEFPIRYIADDRAVLNGGLIIPASSFRAVGDEIRNILSGEAKHAVVTVNLQDFGITREDYGEMCVIGSHHSGMLYDDAVLSPMWCELFVDGRRQTIARYPNDNLLRICGPISEGEGNSGTTHPGIAIDKWLALRNPRGDVYKIDGATAKRASGWKYSKDAWMFGYPKHDWADMSTPITAFDAEESSMTSKYVSRFGIISEQTRNDYANGGGYYLYNVLDELDAPGEWYLDRDTGNLYLYPDTDLNNAQILLSIAKEPIISLHGAKNIEFCGFDVIGTRGNGIGGNGSAITISSCRIKNVSGHGICINGYKNRVISCEICETGRGGIYLTGGERNTLTHGENLAENNYIHDFSKLTQTYQAGIYLEGCGNTARNNEICNTPHMAIGYGGNEHLIEYNHIHDATYNSTDAGAIYSGFDWLSHGTVIRYNLIERIGSDKYSPDGIYWDDGLSGQTAYGNILVGIPKFSVLIGGGRENKFFGNLIIKSGRTALALNDRFKVAYITKAQFYNAISPEGGTRNLFTLASKIPFTSDVWAKKYPRAAAMKLSHDTDPDDPDYPINPSYCEVYANAIIEPDGDVFIIPEGARKYYSRIDTNLVYDSLSYAGIDDSTYQIAKESPIFRDIPEFSPIPTDKIGIRK